jgi:sugar phosphate isomerase/epimerase
MGGDKVELIGSYWTLAGAAYPHTDHEYSPFDFADRVEAAARAGFKGIGIWHADLAHILEKRSLQEMKRILEANGIEHLELEFLTDWFMEGERRKISDAVRRDLFAATDALGARHIKVGDFYREPCPMPRMIESFAQLCAEAKTHGTKILFEFMPFTIIDSLDKVLEFLDGAGADNGGVILDLWHIVRLNIPYEELSRRLPLKYILGVELNDGDLAVPADLHDATVNHRKLCGEGGFDVTGFIHTLDAMGYDGPYGIEVLSTELRKLPLEELVSRAFRTTSAQFQSRRVSNPG